MTDHRRLKSISSRYDIEISRWSFKLRRQRLIATGVCGFLAVLACVSLLWSDHRALESRPVSRPHQVFEENCKVCHTEHWKPLKRLLALDNHVRSVPDSACQGCHAETLEDHLFKTNQQMGLLDDANADQVQLLHAQFARLSCAECHQEHRGQAFLSNVSDMHCTNCHQAMDRAGIPTPFFLNMKSFQDHAEFATVREIKDRSLLERHPSAQLARFEDGVLKDNVSLKFNHHVHLDPELRGPGGKVEQLDCASCHVVDASGAYFRPIQFESHCRRCHQLGTSETGQLPHVAPEMIRGLLLEKLSRAKPEQTIPSTDPIGGPTKSPLPDSSSIPVAEKWGELQTQLAELEERLFGPIPQQQENQEIPVGAHLLETSCSKCHFTRAASGQRVPWTVIPTNIPDRWFTMSHFSHHAHGAVACADCHTKSGRTIRQEDEQKREEFYPKLSMEQKSSPSIFASTTAEDILLPSIALCRDCHGTSRTTARGLGAARSDCIECHDYHHSPVTTPDNSVLKQFLKSKGWHEPETSVAPAEVR